MEATKEPAACGLLLFGGDGEIVEMNEAARAILDGPGVVWAEGHEPATPLEVLASVYARMGDKLWGVRLYDTFELVDGGHLDVGARKLANGHVLAAISTRTRCVICPDALRGLYGLSKAQARVAALLAGGAGTKEAAVEIGVEWDTVRAHCKSICKRMGVTTVREACRIILTGPACAL